MIFNSVTFVIFLTIVLLLYYQLGYRGQNWMLILASYVFYGWWDYRFLGLLLFTTLFDYYCALWIEREKRPARRRLLLASSMTVNLGVLCIFKYFNFFAHSLENALGDFGVTLSFPMLHIVLPVGISFYTFLSMSYTIDVYRRELRATHKPTEFMLYVAFFPHLVAGPIVRASILLPQCQRPRRIVGEEVANGIWMVLLGYVKKVVIADRLAQVVTWGFARGTPAFTDANSWLVIYAFAFQIYGDFSGYSDIARGVSKLMGFELVENFRAPYLVANASEFWRHWHISLSTWLRDYLYVPLGGNRKGRLRTYGNLMATMLLGGLWHGAGAAYVLWGLYHGTLLACQRAWKDFIQPCLRLAPGFEPGTPLALPSQSMHSSVAGLKLPMVLLSAAGEGNQANQVCSPGCGAKTAAGNASAEMLTLPGDALGSVSGKLPPPRHAKPVEASAGSGWQRWLPVARQTLLVFVFFHLTCLGWLLFRAGSLPVGVDQLEFVLDYLATMFVFPASTNAMAVGILILGAASLFFQWKYDAMNHFSRWPRHAQVLGVIAALAVMAALGVFEGAQFIYFQF